MVLIKMLDKKGFMKLVEFPEHMPCINYPVPHDYLNFSQVNMTKPEESKMIKFYRHKIDKELGVWIYKEE